jgi:hypothetical protein
LTNTFFHRHHDCKFGKSHDSGGVFTYTAIRSLALPVTTRSRSSRDCYGSTGTAMAPTLPNLKSLGGFITFLPKIEDVACYCFSLDFREPMGEGIEKYPEFVTTGSGQK